MSELQSFKSLLDLRSILTSVDFTFVSEVLSRVWVVLFKKLSHATLIKSALVFASLWYVHYLEGPHSLRMFQIILRVSYGFGVLDYIYLSMNEAITELYWK